MSELTDGAPTREEVEERWRNRGSLNRGAYGARLEEAYLAALILIDHLRGAVAADDARLRAAEIRAWGEPRWGCDAAEHLADMIIEMRFTRDEWFRERLVSYLPEDPCKECSGFGRKTYGNTSTWRHGFGGQMLTEDVCDNCWGSGSSFRSGANLRALSGRMRALEVEVRRLGGDMPGHMEGGG